MSGGKGKKGRGKRGRRGNKNKKKSKQATAETSTLFHSVDIVQQFTEVSVGAPNYRDQVANTIK